MLLIAAASQAANSAPEEERVLGVLPFRSIQCVILQIQDADHWIRLHYSPLVYAAVLCVSSLFVDEHHNSLCHSFKGYFLFSLSRYLFHPCSFTKLTMETCTKTDPYFLVYQDLKQTIYQVQTSGLFNMLGWTESSEDSGNNARNACFLCLLFVASAWKTSSLDSIKLD